MAIVNSPEDKPLSEADKFRNELFRKTMPFLQSLAWHALNKQGRGNDEVALVCIDIDSSWRDVIDRFLPSQDWEELRKGSNGKSSVVVGCFDWEICEIIADRLPDLADIILAVPREGVVHAIILARGGGAVYEIKPEMLPPTLH